MTSAESTLTRRPRWYAATIVGAIVLIAVFFLAAALVDDDLADGVFGFFAGMIGAILISLVLWTEIVRKRLARIRDAAALDDLEPLRAATAADRTAAAPATVRPATVAPGAEASVDQPVVESNSDRPVDR